MDYKHPKSNNVVYFIAQDTLDGSKSPYSIWKPSFYSGKRGLRAFQSYAAAERSMRKCIGYDARPQDFIIVRYTENN